MRLELPSELQDYVFRSTLMSNPFEVPLAHVFALRLTNRLLARLWRWRVAIHGPPAALVEEIDVETLYRTREKNKYALATVMLYHYRQTKSYETNMNNVGLIVRQIIMLAERSLQTMDDVSYFDFGHFVSRVYHYLERKQRSQPTGTGRELEYVPVPWIFRRVFSGMSLERDGFADIALTLYGREVRVR
tara:strand:- start:472 stop:1038 length:567 start_codon:yes stop_codon:yes gene_type:complete